MATDRLATSLITVAFAAVTIPWVSIVVTVYQKGSKAFHAKYLTDDMRITPSSDLLQYGGVAHAIIGTLLMVLIASLIAVPLGILAAVYIVEIKGRFAKMVRFLTQAMSGVPSIVAGLFIYATVVIFFGGVSAWAGALSLVILMLPTVARTSEEVLKIVPEDLRSASYALGASQARTTFRVVLSWNCACCGRNSTTHLDCFIFRCDDDKPYRTYCKSSYLNLFKSRFGRRQCHHTRMGRFSCASWCCLRPLCFCSTLQFTPFTKVSTHNG